MSGVVAPRRMSLEGLDGGNCGIACTADGSLLAVSNQLSYTITMYSSADGALVRTFGVKGAGEGEFDSPRGLLFTPTPASSLLVAEDDNLRVQEVSVTGEHLRFIGVGVIDGPIVSVALCGDTLAVGKGYEASGDQIMLFCFSTGALLSSFASYGSEPGEISTATGIAFTLDGGRILVSEDLDRLSLFTVDGTFLSCLAKRKLYYPSGLAFTADGTSLLVADRGNDRLCVFNVDAVAEENTLTLTLREAFGDLAGPIALAVSKATPFSMDVPTILAGFAREYSAALLEGGDASSLLPFPPAPSRPLPSPQLAAILRTVFGGRKLVPPEAYAMYLPQLRDVSVNMLKPMAGDLEVPAVPAVAMESKAGVGGYWVSWPGVDTSSSSPVLLYYHGGGMVRGTALYTHGFLSRLSRTFNARVLSVEYPLCPDVTASGAVAAGLAAYEYILTDCGVAPGSVLMLGESGGAQMVLLILQAVVEKGLPAPAAAWLISAVTRADEEALAHYNTVTTDVVFGAPQTMTAITDLLRHAGKSDELPYGHPSFSPYHGPTGGLPPLFFSYDSQEIFALSNEQMLSKLADAGVSTASSVTSFGLHAMVVFNAPEALQEIVIAKQWLSQYFSPSAARA